MTAQPVPDPLFTLRGDMAAVHGLLFHLTEEAEHLYASTQAGIVHKWDLEIEMADDKQTEEVPQVGGLFGDEFRPLQEGMPMDSGEGNLQLFKQETFSDQVWMETGGGAEPFGQSRLITRYQTPPINTTVTTGLWEQAVLHKSVQQELLTETHVKLESEQDGDDYKQTLPRSEWKCHVRERKEAEGVWLSDKQWREQRGLQPKRKKRDGAPSPNLDNSNQGVSTLRGGIEHQGSTKRPTRWDAPPQHTASSAVPQASAALKDQFACSKLVIAPAAYPVVRFTDEDCLLLQRRLIELLMTHETTDGPLQFAQTFKEKGVLVVSCVNEVTSAWLKKTVHILALKEGKDVIVGDYRDVLKTTKVLLRTFGVMAELEPTQILACIQRQNTDVKTTDWRIVCCRREEGFQTLVLSVDKSSTNVLKRRRWRVYLGIEMVTLKDLSCAPNPSGYNPDCARYETDLSGKVEAQSPGISDTSELDQGALDLNERLVSSFEECCPLSTGKAGRRMRKRQARLTSPWWSTELNNMRKTVRAQYKRSRVTNNWKSYHRLLTQYNLAVRRAKRQCLTIEKSK